MVNLKEAPALWSLSWPLIPSQPPRCILLLQIISLLSRCKDKIARSNYTKEDMSSINDTNIPQNTQNNLLSITIQTLNDTHPHIHIYLSISLVKYF